MPRAMAEPCPAVLFLVFNRPDVTQQVFEAIRKAKPPRLYIAADGPRPDRPGEAERCQQVRDLIQVDWDAEVHTLYREENLGIRKAVNGALDWFFEHEKEGVILEDDCLPNDSFFPFMAEMLARYRDDLRVGTVSGSNYQLGRFTPNESYYFSHHVHIWGWGTWRRVWKSVDPDLKQWPLIRDTSVGHALLGSGASAEFWKRRFDRSHEGILTAWSYAVVLASWLQNQVSIIPSYNLVRNIGALNGTNVKFADKFTDMPTKELSFPLVHPDFMVPAMEADERTSHEMFVDHSLPQRALKRLVRTVLHP